MIITLSGAKGGTGKSTLAVHPAAEWAARGLRVLLVDTDPQGTAITWGEVRASLGRDKPTVIPTGDNVRQAVGDIAPSFDVVDVIGRPNPRVIGEDRRRHPNFFTAARRWRLGEKLPGRAAAA